MIHSDIYRELKYWVEIVGPLRGTSFVSIGTLDLPVPLVDRNNLPSNLLPGETIRGLSMGLPPDGGPMQGLPEDGSIYLNLDCGGKGNTVMGLAQASYEMPVSGSHDMNTGYTAVFKAKDGGVFLLQRPSGLNTVLLVGEGVVYKCKLHFAGEMFKALGRELPFTLTEGKTTPQEWRELKPYNYNSLDF